MADDTAIPIEFLRQCFDADADAGTARWRQRPREHFATTKAWATWNAKYAGTVAGSPNSEGYLQVKVTFAGRQRQLRIPRVVWAMTHGCWPSDQVDHANGVEAGDGIGNLREATNAENCQNRKTHRNNTSGFPGVSWTEHRCKWKAQISADPYSSSWPLRHQGRSLRRLLRRQGYPPPLRSDAAWRRCAGPSLPPARTAHLIVKAARRYGDTMLELDAWDHFVAAL